MNNNDLIQVKKALESLRRLGNDIENDNRETISKDEVLSLVKEEYYVLDEIVQVLENL